MKNYMIYLFLLLFLTIGQSVLAQDVFPLYETSIPNNTLRLDSNDKPTFQVYFPEVKKRTGTSIIIFPGGAYAFLAYKEEGIEIAQAFAQKGITAIVVKYRLPNNQTMLDKSVGPLMDAQQAIKRVRENALEWMIDPNKIGIIGYSAGGHLASTLGTHFMKSYIPNPKNVSLRPDFMILVYPVISMQDNLTHVGSKISLLGMEPSKKVTDLFSNELQVSRETPPTYLTHTGDDDLVSVNNSIVFYQALQKKGLDAELHLLPKGNHGFTQRLPVNEWMNPMLDFLKREGFYTTN